MITLSIQLPPDAGVAVVSLRTPLILPSDDIRDIAVDASGDVVEDGDVICITESVVARSQNRYITCDELSKDIREKLRLTGGDRLAVISPIVSRNRFALILRAIASATSGGHVVVQLSIPDDEVGNKVVEEEFATRRLRLKNIYNSLLDLRGDTPHMNVLIREVLAALKLQEIGYDVTALRKITGEGTADLTLRDPEGKTVVAEVSFQNLAETAARAEGIRRDVGADAALAIVVDLERDRITMTDAVAMTRSGPETAALREFRYLDQLPHYRDPNCIYSAEVEGRRFSHPITGMDYPRMYLDLIETEGASGEILLTNNPLKVFEHGLIDGVIIGAVHTSDRLKDLFTSFGTRTPLLTIKDLGPKPWGVIGSNASDVERGVLKLLPDNADETADGIKECIRDRTGKEVEVLIFGDGAYKDPDTGIFELADPHPSIGCSIGLRRAALRQGTKLKLKVETWFRQGHTREEIEEMVKSDDSAVSRETLGTTPRSVTSILGTLADLAAGSADAGTPIVLVRNFPY
ncbi:MAG: coenzyme F420-0:L-glutamate ligase [Clostridia bacterium]